MSSVSISYGSLKDASGEAKAVAKKLEKYSDSINDNVYKKLNNYNGSWSSNLSTAKTNTNSKMTSLRDEAERYEKYADNLIALKDECISVDKSVKSKVSSLTATFKETYGIRNSKVENAINYFLTKVGNSTSFGRWLGDEDSKAQAKINDMKASIKEWYNYEGGKEWLKGTAVALLEVAIGVVSIALAIVSGGALLVIIAGVIAGVIALADGAANLYNEQRAFFGRSDSDPAASRRLSDLNTATDTLRTEFDSKVMHNIATGIDVVNFACSAITLISSCGKLLKNGYKWATGCSDKLKDIRYGSVFTKDTLLDFGRKIKGNFSTGWRDLKAAVSSKSWSYGGRILEEFTKDFKANFNNKFLNFDSLKEGLTSTKNVLGITKDVVKDGIGLGNLTKVSIKNIAVPCITIADLPIASGSRYDAVAVDDFYSIYDKIDTKLIKSPLFDNDKSFSLDVLKKLSTVSKVNISIPDVYVPIMELPKVRMA
jgi:hypothetical protein